MLQVKADGIYVDATFGGGGHSREICSHLKQGRLIAFDKDPDARQNLPNDDRLTFIGKDFKFIESVLAELGIEKVNGILADLGVSSHQIDTPERGFSFRFEAPLDMRMNPELETTAADLLNNMEEKQLLELFYLYGEIANAKKLVRIIVDRRKSEKISTTTQFEGIIQSCIPKNRQSKYLAQVYQALRIVVNDELGALRQLLRSSLEILKPAGRIAIIAYHSLEDRMVKRFFRAGNLSGKVEKDFYGNSLSPWKLITRRAFQADQEELSTNPRARSARLRVAEKI